MPLVIQANPFGLDPAVAAFPVAAVVAAPATPVPDVITVAYMPWGHPGNVISQSAPGAGTRTLRKDA